MVELFPALTVALCVMGATLGFLQMKADQVTFLDADDIRLLKDDKKATAKDRPSIFDRWALRLVPWVERVLGATVMGWLDRQVEAAGPGATTRAQILRNISKLCLFMLPLGLVLALQGRIYAIPLVLAGVFILPVSRVAAAARKRKEQIEQDLPDFLDVLAVTVSAGLAFRAALRRVTDYFDGPLADEVKVALNELEHGLTMRAALQGVTARTRSDLVERFVRAFLQAEELGAPLAQTLNEIALDIRRESAQKAKKRASEAAPKISVVTTVFLTPASIILIVAGIYLGSGIDLSEMGLG